MARGTRKNQKPEDIRKKINYRFYRPLNEKEWNYLFDKGYIDDVQHNELTIDDVVEVVHDLREAFGTTDEPQQGDGPPLLSKEEAKAYPDRFFTLSLFFSEEARKDAEVIAFRF
jgi:hypothetical protein